MEASSIPAEFLQMWNVQSTSEEENSFILEFMKLSYEEIVYDVAIPKFFTFCSSAVIPSNLSSDVSLFSFLDGLLTAIKEFHFCCSSIYSHPGIEKLDKTSVVKLLKNLNRTWITWSSTEQFQKYINTFFKIGFTVFQSYQNIFKNGELLEEDCLYKKYLQALLILGELGLLERFAADSAETTAFECISNHVDGMTGDEMPHSQLHKLQTWCSATVLSWLWYTFNPQAAMDDLERGVVNSHMADSGLEVPKKKLNTYVRETYGKRLIKDIFSIVVEFPDTKATFDDLREILSTTGLRTELVPKLKGELERRVLHPGVATVDILTCYISTIRALQYLDSTGVLLDLVSQPVKLYLKTREDTVRSVVANFSSDDNSELADELYRVQVSQDSICQREQSLDYWMKWQPDPIDAVPVLDLKSGRGADLITLLINIYGTQQLFVTEYTNLLAERLLRTLSYDCDKDLVRLETLKKRLGESELQECEVMLKDIADSRRITQSWDGNANGEASDEEIRLRPLVLSAQYWPSVRQERLELPAPWQALLHNYTSAYEKLKGSRTLDWKPNLGNMTLELELHGRKLELSVSPSVAAVLYHFQLKEQWSVEELATELKMSATTVRKKCLFWQGHGLLIESGADSYQLCLSGNISTAPTVINVAPSEEDAPMVSAQQRQDEEMQVYWSYVVGMLTNLESMTLERLHSMLQLFAVSGATSVSQEQLKQFLDSKVRSGALNYSSDKYSLVK